MTRSLPLAEQPRRTEQLIGLNRVTTDPDRSQIAAGHGRYRVALQQRVGRQRSRPEIEVRDNIRDPYIRKEGTYQIHPPRLYI